MSKIRQILRMHSQGQSILSTASKSDTSRNTVKRYLKAFTASGFTFCEINALNDKELEDFFGKSKEPPPHDRMQSLLRCFPHVDKEAKHGS